MKYSYPGADFTNWSRENDKHTTETTETDGVAQRREKFCPTFCHEFKINYCDAGR